ncbi:MAG: hypothetical protein ACLUKO_16540 [Enterocloster bolteae]
MQPLEYPAPAAPLNAPGYFAGKLIEDAGLRGYQLGGAGCLKALRVVINSNGATASDVMALCDHVRRVMETWR